MLIDLRDPASIAAWIKVAPHRHVGQLRGLWALCPDFRSAIVAAVLTETP